jgi:hypothetical protein
MTYPPYHCEPARALVELGYGDFLVGIKINQTSGYIAKLSAQVIQEQKIREQMAQIGEQMSAGSVKLAYICSKTLRECAKIKLPSLDKTPE